MHFPQLTLCYPIGNIIFARRWFVLQAIVYNPVPHFAAADPSCRPVESTIDPVVPDIYCLPFGVGWIRLLIITISAYALIELETNSPGRCTLLHWRFDLSSDCTQAVH